MDLKDATWMVRTMDQPVSRFIDGANGVLLAAGTGV